MSADVIVWYVHLPFSAMLQLRQPFLRSPLRVPYAHRPTDTNNQTHHAGMSAASLRGAFFDSFASYAVATDRLSTELSAQAPTGEEDPDEDPLINADRKLLVLLSNCAFVRGSIMPSLIDRCATLAGRHLCRAQHGCHDGPQ